MFALSKTAFFAIVDDWRQALKISGMWFGIYAVFWLYLAFLGLAFGPPEGADSIGPNSAITYIAFIVMVVCGISLYVLGVSNIAIAWHRLQLQNRKHKGYFWFDYDGPWWDYFWWLNVVGFVGGLAALPLLMTGIIGWIPFFDSPDVLFTLGIFAGLGAVIALFVSMRLSLILPAIAIGSDELVFFSSWALTRPIWKEILVASLLLSCMATTQFGVLTVLPHSQGVSVSWLIIVIKPVLDWSTFMFGVSVLTTMHGRLLPINNPVGS